MSLSFASEETLDIVLGVEESTTVLSATFAFAPSFSFAFTAKALLEEAAESPYWFAVEASPGFPGHPVLIEQRFRGFGIGHDGGIRCVVGRKRFVTVV